MALNSMCFTRQVLLKSVHSKVFATSSFGLAYIGLSLPRGIGARLNHKKSSTGNGILGQSTILMQDGSDFQELPIIVRKITNKDNIELLGNRRADEIVDKTCNKTGREEFIDIAKDEEAREIIDGFNRCYSPKGIFALLDLIPSDEVTPYVALQALKKIIILENNKEFRNPVNIHDYVEVEEEKSKNFTRTAVLNQLVDMIASSDDAGIVLNGLKLVSRDLVGGSMESYKEKLCNEILCRATDGKFTIEQICEAVKVFSTLDNKDVDKLWVGIVEKSNDINNNNIMDVFKCLPYLKKSRKVILNILEKKLFLYWWKLSGRDVAEVLCILKEDAFSNRILGVLSRWINTNIHTVNEEELLNIVNGFRALDYCNQGIYKALERYVKVKGVTIQNQGLITCICDYCFSFRIRSSHILQGVSEYLIEHGNSLSPITLKSIFTLIGYLDYYPVNGLKFWQMFESIFEEKFVQFRPEDALDMLLSCVYLEKYPLNFVKKVFNPYFLDRLHSCKSDESIQAMRTKLKILDFSMALECASYRGPLLPKDNSASSVWNDGRAKRILNFISMNLSEFTGRMNRMSFMVKLPQVPLSDLYIIDVLIYPNNVRSAMNFLRDRDLYTAVLIIMPEHYCNDGKKLIGPQVMRKRHFRKLGLKVVTLDYGTLARYKVHPVDLNEYLRERFKNPELSL